MARKKHITIKEATGIGEKLGIRWDTFDVGQFRKGMMVELEHGFRDPATNVTNDNLLITGKIALAHLNELPDYYDRLAKMENKKAPKNKSKAKKKIVSFEEYRDKEIKREIGMKNLKPTQAKSYYDYHKNDEYYKRMYKRYLKAKKK